MKNNFKLCAFADEAAVSLDGQIKALKDNQVSLLEIRGVDGRNISTLTLDEAKEVKKKLDDAGIKVWSLGSPIGKSDINADFEIEKAVYMNLLEVGKILEAKVIRMFSYHNTTQTKECLDEVCRRIQTYVDLAKPYGFVLCHENEKGIYGELAPGCLEILTRVNGLKAAFDPANFIQCGQDVPQAWEMLKEHVYYGHIKDALPNGKVVPAGKGIGNLDKILPEFPALGIEVLSIEPHLGAFIGLKDLEQDGARSEIGTSFKDPREAFDCAVSSLKELIEKI